MKSKADETAWAGWRDPGPPHRLRKAGLAGCACLVTLLFVQPLARLIALALQSDLHSYLPIVPVISAYLLYIQPKTVVFYRSSIGPATVLAAVGFASLAVAVGLGERLNDNDHLALMMLAYVSFLVASGFLFFGSPWMRSAAFPVAFLIFIVPLPDAAVSWLELRLVAASADAAAWMFRVTGTPMLRQGTIITLPGIALEVARECSGIRSTVVLFITSVLGSNLFLQSTSRRIALAASVIPLAILRNGFRILVIGLLCVHIGPHMTDSFIHRRGGPIFFALSLIPLALILFWLRRHDKRVGARP